MGFKPIEGAWRDEATTRGRYGGHGPWRRRTPDARRPWESYLKPLLCRVGGAKEENGALPCTPPSRPRLPGPAFQPPPHPRLRLHPHPASGRGPFLPQLVLWGRGAARRRLYGQGSERKGERGREYGRWRGLGRGAEARPGLPHVHSTLQAGPGLSQSQVSRSRIKAPGGARARPRAVLGTDPPPRSRGPARGEDPRGEQCSLGSGSRLLVSGGIEGELVLELQQ